ncbi:hypothetical protein LCGC14_2876970 [marine sediment metagenome]|uniref:Uncharacterized protein n=1 Tax=marine sediment metagenome TaxID=412755 RepID=A0A0F9A9B3_9ZZZZ
MTNEEKDDLISQFISDSDASAEDKQALDWALNKAHNVLPIDPQRLRQLVLKLADWCYDEGYDDGEAGRQ